MENETNSPNGYGKYIDEKLNEAVMHYFADSTDEEKYSVADVFYAGLRTGKDVYQGQVCDANLSDCSAEYKKAYYDGYNKCNRDWLEKQFTPQFKIGNWITDGYNVYQVINVVLGPPNIGKYIVTSGIETQSVIYFEVEHNYRLWDIKDTEDGDVLTCRDCIVMFKDFYNDTTFHSYCHIENGELHISSETMPDWWESEGFHPSTCEEKDLLLTKLDEKTSYINKIRMKIC